MKLFFFFLSLFNVLSLYGISQTNHLVKTDLSPEKYANILFEFFIKSFLNVTINANSTYLIQIAYYEEDELCPKATILNKIAVHQLATQSKKWKTQKSIFYNTKKKKYVGRFVEFKKNRCFDIDTSLTNFEFLENPLNLQNDKTDFLIYEGFYDSDYVGAFSHRSAYPINPEEMKNYMNQNFKNYEKYLRDFFDLNKEADIEFLKKEFERDVEKEYGTTNITSERKEMALVLLTGYPQLYLLNINGHPSDDIVYFRNEKTGRYILYIPEPSRAIVKDFPDYLTMVYWISGKLRSKSFFESFLAHFDYSVQENGFFYAGVRDTLRGLARYSTLYQYEGYQFWYSNIGVRGVYYPPLYINRRTIPIKSREIFFEKIRVKQNERLLYNHLKSIPS